MIRQPVVADQFYPGTRNALRSMITSLLGTAPSPVNALGAIAPHAGYIYSGGVAGSVYAAVQPKRTYVIMGPNHTGLGKPFSISAAESWKTPLGTVPVNTDLASAIVQRSARLSLDDRAHAGEHSIEVQLPFLQVTAGTFSVVPIVVAQAPLDVFKEIAGAIADTVKELHLTDEIMLIASSDMTHYESEASAREKDTAAIKAILALHEDDLTNTVVARDISMCGYAPVAVMLAAAKALGGNHAQLIKYETSGKTSGDYGSVVGYAGIIITREQ